MADNQNENNNYEQIIEAILFAAGRVVTEQELMIALEMSQEKIENIINKMQIVDGDGSTLDISPVYNHIKDVTPKKKNTKKDIIVPSEKKIEKK